MIADDARSYGARQTQPKSKPQKAIPEPREKIIEPIEINWDVVVDILKVIGVIVAVVATIVTMSALLAALAAFGVGVLVVAVILGALAFDPKLIVLISDGNGGTIWVCLYTWFDTPSKE